MSSPVPAPSPLKVETSNGVYVFEANKLGISINDAGMLSVYEGIEEIKEGEEPHLKYHLLRAFNSWRGFDTPQAVDLMRLEVAPEPVPQPAGYGTVFIPHGEDQMIYQRQGYALLHKDHADVVGVDKMKGTVLTLMVSPLPQPAPEYMCQDCAHIHDEQDLDDPAAPCHQPDDVPGKFGSDCPNFKKLEADE